MRSDTLEKAAELARGQGFEGFTTSLLVSPYQKHELIRLTGEACAEKYGVPFMYYDWRDKYPDTIRRSKELELYRQPYCGCIYSEWERYKKK
jgi:predicted adenine nucleotide alpha hydrolase (AANH) superfamily ATPase